VGAVTSVAISPDGKTLASGSRDGTAKLWDVGTKLDLSTLKGHVGAVTSVAFSPDGKTIATGGSDRVVKLYFAATNEEVAAQR